MSGSNTVKHLHNGVERKMELLSLTTAWMELESIMLSKVGGERQIPYDLT